LGCGANLAKQLVAVNNTGYKLATIHISIINFAVVGIAFVNFIRSVDVISIFDFIRPVNESRYQLNDNPDHDDPNHPDLKR
jgi:hypothetical protein